MRNCQGNSQNHPVVCVCVFFFNKFNTDLVSDHFKAPWRDSGLVGLLWKNDETCGTGGL